MEAACKAPVDDMIKEIRDEEGWMDGDGRSAPRKITCGADRCKVEPMMVRITHSASEIHSIGEGTKLASKRMPITKPHGLFLGYRHDLRSRVFSALSFANQTLDAVHPFCLVPTSSSITYLRTGAYETA